MPKRMEDSIGMTSKRFVSTHSVWNWCFLLVLLSPLGSEASSIDSYEIDANGNMKRSLEENKLREASEELHDLNFRIQDELNVDEGDLIPPVNQPSSEDGCGLYLAPSTIEGAGLGMFTTRHRYVGETVGYGEVVIPMVEVDFYIGNQEDVFNPFRDYYWKGPEKGLFDVVNEDRLDEVTGFVPGLDAAVNCNLALINVENSGSTYDSSGLNRNKDAMAGAMTPYHTTPSPVIEDIPAGGELFKFYGDLW